MIKAAADPKNSILIDPFSKLTPVFKAVIPPIIIRKNVLSKLVSIRARFPEVNIKGIIGTIAPTVNDNILVILAIIGDPKSFGFSPNSYRAIVSIADSGLLIID